MKFVTIPSQLTGFEFKHCNHQLSHQIIKENEKVSNDYFEKSNEFTGYDCIGRKLDLSSIINKSDNYLQGKLSDGSDVDYYKFDTLWYKSLNMVDKYNVDITITLDNIPAGCEYELILYDELGNQVGIGTDNGSGGRSINVPNWNMNNKLYTVKVQMKDGSSVNEKEYYHLSFQTSPASKNNGAYQQMKEVQSYNSALRHQLHEGKDTTETIKALEEIRSKYDTYYTEQLQKLHEEQAKEYMQTDATFAGEGVNELLSKMAAGESLTDNEKEVVKIFATAQEYDSAVAKAKLSTSLKDEIFSQLEASGIDVGNTSFAINIDSKGQSSVEGIEDEKIKKVAEDVVQNNFSYKMLQAYIMISPEIQKLPDEEQELLKAGVDIEEFLHKSTKGQVTLKDIIIENGKIKGLPKNLEDIINQPGANQMLMDYKMDILAIKNYERMQKQDISAEFMAYFTVSKGTIQLK